MMCFNLPLVMAAFSICWKGGEGDDGAGAGAAGDRIVLPVQYGGGVCPCAKG